jgi:hypothetical protein
MATGRRNMTPTQMALTPMSKQEHCPVVCSKLFLALDASRRMHNTSLVRPPPTLPSLGLRLVLHKGATLVGEAYTICRW